MSKEALKLALEALKLDRAWLETDAPKMAWDKNNEAITAIKEALAQHNEFNPDWDVMAVMVEEQQRMAKRIAELEAQPEQEPVACPYCHNSHTLGAVYFDQNCVECVKRMTTPPQRTWVGLTDEERNDCLVSADPCEALAEPEARQLMEDVEAKLREKNT